MERIHKIGRKEDVVRIAMVHYREKSDVGVVWPAIGV
jgi:hypothetical protein